MTAAGRGDDAERGDGVSSASRPAAGPAGLFQSCGGAGRTRPPGHGRPRHGIRRFAGPPSRTRTESGCPGGCVSGIVRPDGDPCGDRDHAVDAPAQLLDDGDRTPLLHGAREGDPPLAHFRGHVPGIEPQGAMQKILGDLLANGLVTAEEDPQQITAADDAQEPIGFADHGQPFDLLGLHEAGGLGHGPLGPRAPRERTSAPRPEPPRPWHAPTPRDEERGSCPTGRSGRHPCAADRPRAPRPPDGRARPPRARR